MEFLFKCIDAALKEKTISKTDFKINFFGKKHNLINDLILKYHLQDYVKQHGNVSRLESIKQQHLADALIFFNFIFYLQNKLSNLLK